MTEINSIVLLLSMNAANISRATPIEISKLR